MKKINLTLFIFVMLTLSLTQMALAEWKANTVKNETTGNVYVIYSTWRGAAGVVPRGYRTLGYYRIAAGQERAFRAWANNSIYFRISKSGEAIKPQSSTETFAFWVHQRKAFTVVTQQLSASVTRGAITYTNQAASELVQEDGFMKYANGSRVTITPGWVNVTDINLPEESVDVDGNCVVDAADVALVASRLGETGPNAADVNGDGVVNVADTTLVSNALGTVIDDCGGGTETDKPPPLPPPTEGMVLIPAGEFQMGSEHADADVDEQPVHTVYVDAFYMDTHEVTNAQYAAFLTAKGKHANADPNADPNADHTWLDIVEEEARIEHVGGVYRAKAGYETHPVVYVSWYGAMAYAAWAGKRLPTEAEWEKAARGGLTGQKYPWQNTISANYGRNVDDTQVVGSYPANDYGLYDMAGNVWEWCLDKYDRDFYATSPRDNPFSGDTIIDVISNFTNVKGTRVLRGGSWRSAKQDVRVAERFRRTPASTDNGYGFRCARAVTP